MANPRKFSEKIALQKLKEAEGTAEFEKIMKEVHATKMDESQINPKIMACSIRNADSSSRPKQAGGMNRLSLKDSTKCNQTNVPVLQTNINNRSIPSLDESNNTSGNTGSVHRESRGRSIGVGPMRRPPERKQDRSPYGSNSNNVNSTSSQSTCVMADNFGVGAQNFAYLSPPIDSSWRRSNSDSALHQSLNNAVAAESNFCVSGVENVNLPGSASNSHNYFPNINYRSHSPNIGINLNPTATKKKNSMLLCNHNQQQQQHNLHQQYPQTLSYNPHYSEYQQQQLDENFHSQFPAKFSSNQISNNYFKTIQDQSISLASTGSLPDLTSVHYSTSTQPQLLQFQPNQQQMLVPGVVQNNKRDLIDQQSSEQIVEQPSSPYLHQSSPKSTATSTTAQTSPSLSFTNIPVSSISSAPPEVARNRSFNNLPTLGATNSTNNLTDYRQPTNPPSPGSSPGLLISVTGNEMHASAPASPIHHQTNISHILQNYSEKNIPPYDRYSPSLSGIGNIDSTYNILNTTFQDNFQNFSLCENNSSPERFQQHQPNFILNFENYGNTNNACQQVFGQNMDENKISEFTSPTTAETQNRNTPTRSPVTTCSNNNVHQNPSDVIQQQSINNNRNNGTSSPNPINENCTHTNATTNNNSNLTPQKVASTVSRDALGSPMPSPIGYLTSPSSPLPIPISSPTCNQHQQLSLQSPHHSPQHPSPLSSSSPGLSTVDGITTGLINNSSSSPYNASIVQRTAQNQPHIQIYDQSSHQLQNQPNSTNNATIPSIIFSDYSSNSDLSREIFENLDLDFEQMDVTGLQILSDQNSIIITDTVSEDGFRRDLN